MYVRENVNKKTFPKTGLGGEGQPPVRNIFFCRRKKMQNVLRSKNMEIGRISFYFCLATLPWINTNTIENHRGLCSGKV